MGKKYIITYRNYDCASWHQRQTDWFIMAMVLMIVTVPRFAIVDIEYRRKR